nr:UvrB/UvrC motif-containing protein [uncultured Oscillibacter sp.]
MKCENCGKNEVTFVYQSNVNGQVTEKHLCAECAEKLGYTQRLAAQSQRMMRGLFGGGLFDDFFTPVPSLLSRMNRMLEDPFDDFFADMPALGAPAEAKPEAPKAQETLLEQEEQNEISKKRQLNALRMEMQKAVQEENFERAAELRDQIHSLEQN